MPYHLVAIWLLAGMAVLAVLLQRPAVEAVNSSDRLVAKEPAGAQDHAYDHRTGWARRTARGASMADANSAIGEATKAGYKAQTSDREMP